MLATGDLAASPREAADLTVLTWDPGALIDPEGPRLAVLGGCWPLTADVARTSAYAETAAESEPRPHWRRVRVRARVRAP